MWGDEKTLELKERITGMSDDELLKMVEVDFEDIATKRSTSQKLS